MSFNMWATLSVGVIVATIVLQLINFNKFHKDGANSTRYTLMIKEILFIGHALMLIAVTDVVNAYFHPWFGNMFGVLFFGGACCWLAVYIKGTK